MTAPRALPRVVVSMPTPVVVAGKPTMPGLRAGIPVRASSIRKITYGPPPAAPAGQLIGLSGPMSYASRWTVEDLPDPAGFSNGWYWLGEPSSYDYTAGIQAACRQWIPTRDSRLKVAWHSVFPFKPSVTARDSWLFGGGVVHHPKGVNFNSFYVEHMWLDQYLSNPQPFTWVIACLVANWPNPVQYLLDAGKPPPRSYSVDELGWAHQLNEGLSYRTMLQLRSNGMDLAATSGTHVLRLTAAVPATPRMYFGIFNGAKSTVGMWGPEGKAVRTGPIQASAAQRYVVLGRQQGVIDRARASHLLVFEIRFFATALPMDVLHDIYGDMSSRWQFGRYARGG